MDDIYMAQVDELALEICPFLISQEAFQKNVPAQTKAFSIALHLVNCGYVKKVNNLKNIGKKTT